MIQTVNDARIIGNVNLDEFKENLFNAFVGISIGDPNDWGKGFGTEAMKLILRYGFDVLNLHRISLTFLNIT